MKQITKYSVITAIVALSCFLLVTTINKCSSNHTVTTTNQLNISQIRQNVIDSIKSIEISKQIAAIDSVTKSNNKTVVLLQSNIKLLKSKLNASINNYHSDTIKVPICDTIIKQCNQLTDSLDREVLICNETTFNLETKIDLQDTLLVQKETHIQSLNANCYKLQKELQKQNNWWHRNQMNIGFIIGAVFVEAINIFAR